MQRTGAGGILRALALLYVAALLSGLAGCRLTRQSDTVSFAPSRPTASERATEGAHPGRAVKPGGLPATAGPQAYADALSSVLTRAREQARKGELADLNLPGGTLAMANLYLSMLEARLPEATALSELQRAAQLVADRRPRDAAEVLDSLALSLSADAATVSAAELQAVIDVILSERPQQALPRLLSLSADLAASPLLQEASAVRAALQDAASAAARRNEPLLEAALADASLRTTRLGEALARQR